MRQVECGVRRRTGWFLPGVELRVRDNVAGLRGSPLSSPGPSTGVSMQQEWELFQNCNKRKKKKRKNHNSILLQKGRMLLQDPCRKTQWTVIFTHEAYCTDIYDYGSNISRWCRCKKQKTKKKSTDGSFALTAAKCVLLLRKETRTHISHPAVR